MNSQASFIMSDSQFSNIEKRMDKIEREMKDGFSEIMSEIKSLKNDTDVLTEGDARHGVEPVRQVARRGVKEATRANQRIDQILWIVAGISVGSGVGGGIIVKILFGI